MRRGSRPPGTSKGRDARRAGPELAARLAPALLAIALIGTHAAASATAPAPTPGAGTARARALRAAAAARLKSPGQIATDARALEQIGAYGQATQTLRQLRGRVGPDADLELALALDEARSDQVDSAAVRLWSPLLSKAIVDSMPTSRRVPYPWQHEGAWLNGRFDGWHWYVARARAEVAARLGRWSDARDAARQALAARERCGLEWLILAVCAGRAGDLKEAERAARAAAWLDPTLPEAQYLTGLYDWRAGRRVTAQEGFRAAVALDSSYREPALALVRSRLPGFAPDTLPTELVGGVRAIGLLTSPARPKAEEFVQVDVSATVIRGELLPLPDSLRGRIRPLEMTLPILVDERGRAALHQLPWLTAQQLPDPVLRLTLESLLTWSFNPATRYGKPQRGWANMHVIYVP